MDPRAQQTMQSGLAIGGTIWAGLAPAAAVPFIGAGIIAVGLALNLLLNRKGGKQKTAATQIADQAEQLLKENVAAYLSGPRTQQSKEAAVGNFLLTWEQLISPEMCGNPELGAAGRRCISERERGGSAPWCPTQTGCDWFALYLDPILNDPIAEPSPSAAASDLAELFTGEDANSLLLPAALVGIGLLLL